MAGRSDRRFEAACGRLASHLGISIAAARRRVDILAAREGIRDAAGRLGLAERLLTETLARGDDIGSLLTAQLRAEGSDEHFMVED